jgi:hypothetical protein
MNRKAKGSCNEHITIKLFAVPANFRKLIHRSRDRQALPDVKRSGVKQNAAK